ncbi:MAG: hypothetical protein JWO98_5341 [Frankiales bacterium]|nr:hypothetical protein [Frankiales bacterium]
MDWSQFFDLAPQWGVTLGVGSSPFIYAILTNKLITGKQHLREMARVQANADQQVKTAEENAAIRATTAKDNADNVVAIISAELDRANVALGNERTAKEVERDRADKLASSLADLTTEFGAVAVHALESLPQIGDVSAPRT